MTVAESLARLQGGYYNSAPYNAVTNPGGMDDGGHSINLPALLVDVGVLSADAAAKAAAAIAARDQAVPASVSANDALAQITTLNTAIQTAAATVVAVVGFDPQTKADKAFIHPRIDALEANTLTWADAQFYGS